MGRAAHLSTRLLLVLALLPLGCGGGGTASDDDDGSGGVVPLGSSLVPPWTGTYGAAYEVRGFRRLEGAPAEAIAGTVGVADLPDTVTSLTNGLEGHTRRTVESFLVDGRPEGETRLAYIHVDAQGNWFRLGGRLGIPDFWWSGTVVYPPPLGAVDGMVLLQPAEMLEGQEFSTPWVEAVDETGALLFEEMRSRQVREITVIETPLGRHECFHVEETLSRRSASAERWALCDRWERPDLGLLALDAVVTDTAGGLTTVTVVEWRIFFHQP